MDNGTPQHGAKAERQLLPQRIAYPLGATEPGPESGLILDSLALVLKQHPDWKLEITGLSYSVGSSEAKKQVSLLQAEKIKQRLLQKGVSEKQLVAIGESDHYPIASNQTEPDRIQNRREKFALIK